MTTKELRAYIDRILGNSIRCLLPSYWWKRAFGATIDIVESVEKNVKNTVKGKQDTLVSGESIKTINGQSILGEGNITIEEGSDVTVDSSLSTTSVNPVQNKVISSKLEQLDTRIDNALGTRNIYFVDPEHNATLESYRVENNKSIVSDYSWRNKLQVNIICKDNTYRCLILSAEKEYGELILYVAKESRTKILEGNWVLFNDYALSHIYKVIVHSDGTCTAEKRLIDIAWNMQNNEEVTAVALNDLNSRLEECERLLKIITNNTEA